MITSILVCDICYLLIGCATYDTEYIYWKANIVADWIAILLYIIMVDFFEMMYFFCQCSLGTLIFYFFGLYSYSLCMKHPSYKKRSKLFVNT